MAALLDAESFIANNPQKAQEIVANTLGAPKDKIKANWREFNYKLKLEQSTVILMEDVSRWMIDQKIVENKKVPNFLNNIDLNTLKIYKPEAVTVIK